MLKQLSKENTEQKEKIYTFLPQVNKNLCREEEGIIGIINIIGIIGMINIKIYFYIVITKY